MSAEPIHLVPSICRSILAAGVVDRMLPPLPLADNLRFLANIDRSCILQLRAVSRGSYNRVFSTLNRLDSTKLVRFIEQLNPAMPRFPPAFYVYLLDKPVAELTATGLSNANIVALMYLTRPVGQLFFSGNDNTVTLPVLTRSLMGKSILKLTLSNTFEEGNSSLMANLMLLNRIRYLSHIVLDQLPPEIDDDVVADIFPTIENLRVISKEEDLNTFGLSCKLRSSMSIERR